MIHPVFFNSDLWAKFGLIFNFGLVNSLSLCESCPNQVENYVLSFYEEILSTPGFHYFKIEVESRDIWCLCPNIGTGFENNKYIFAWTNTNTLFRENEYTYLVKTEDKKYSILV